MFYIKIKFLVRSIHPLPPSDMPDLLKAYKELGDWIIYSGLNVDRMMKGKTLWMLQGITTDYLFIIAFHQEVRGI